MDGELDVSVGRWLEEKGFAKTYKAFLKEAKISSSKVKASPGKILLKAWNKYKRVREDEATPG
eukprot:1358892-Amorphochlora_amoeboformis.AAC.2